jgi:hypothetical protein
MADPTFTRSPGQPIFLLPLNGTPAGYTIAFLPGTDPASNALTLRATWTTTPGIYLFLGTPIADQTTFAAAVRTYVGARPVRFLWIVNPGDEVGAWQANEIDVDPATSTVQPTAQIAFRSVTLSIGSGCTIALNAVGDALVATAADGAVITLLTGFGADSIAAGATMTIPFGAAPGTLQFTIGVGDGDLGKLDTGCRYFFGDTTSPLPGAIASVRYPLFTLGHASVTLYAGLDPVRPLDPRRTVFNFLPTPATPGSALVSGFRTVYGETMTLTPVSSSLWPNGPALVFAVRPQRDYPSSADAYYATFEGPFTLAVQTPSAGDTPIARMMCGYSGIEYAGLPTGAGSVNQIAFASGKPAFAPVLRQAAIIDDATPVNDAVPLTTVATTAWGVLSTTGPSPLPYFAQPHDSVLYQATQTEAADTPEQFLYYLEVFAGTFPAATTANAVPMVPYGLIDPTLADRAAALETQVLAPYRRNLLASILTPTERGADPNVSGSDAGDRRAATPQGLLVSLSEDLTHWNQLSLAQTNGGTQKLQLASITGDFKAALQSNQLFAVISNWQEFMLRCHVVAPFRLTVSGWTFELSPETWNTHQTLVILKYAANVSIDELTADASTWAWQAAANGNSTTPLSGNVATTQADLRDLFARAKADSVANPALRPFVEAITNPNWNGILFLRAPLSSANFPDQLRGIAAGIEPARLFAHHVGIAAAPVHNINQQLTQDDASIFALIDYQDPVDLATTGVDYGFKVLGLTVLFKNSEMASFSSRIELMINRLFGSGAAQRTPGARGNNIILDGFYQSAGGTPAYVFVTTQTNVYGVESSAVASVDITRAQFVTLSPTSSAQTTVNTRFVLDGLLRFAQLSDFDIFAFGPVLVDDALVEDGYLFFSNLAIEMTFPRATPEQTTFRFNAATIAFDLSQSLARPDSLFAHFPLRLTGLLQAPADTTPRDSGFIPVGSPLAGGELTDPWFALTFDLALGTVGSLAGGLDITVQLVAAWSTGGTRGEASVRTFVGIRLPGSAGQAAAFMLQGVVGVTYRAMEFTATRSPQGIEYILRVRGIALRFLTLSFPPGQTDLYIFGDPSGGRSGVIGWYAAYAAKEDKTSTSARQRRLR